MMNLQQLILLQTIGLDSTFTSLAFYLGRKRPNYHSLGHLELSNDVTFALIQIALVGVRHHENTHNAF